MQRFYGIDLTDYRRGELSVRRLSVLVANLPAGSAVWAIQHGLPYGWTLTDILLTDLFHAQTGNPHPARPSASKNPDPKQSADVAAQLLAQRERLKGR